MHPDEQGDVGDVLGIHIQPAKFPISLAKQLNQFHIVQSPAAVDRVGLKAFVMILLNVVTCLEVSHGAASFLAKISMFVILDFTRKLK
jgi:hypothetical protein